MTNEEAIDYIEKWKTDYSVDAKDREVLSMAIKALEQQPCEDYLKKRDGNYVHYNVEWLLKNWQMELDILSDGKIKPCEAKTGHWIFDEILDKHYYCSECKSMGVDYWDYCPYCGAKMAYGGDTE